MKRKLLLNGIFPMLLLICFPLVNNAQTSDRPMAIELNAGWKEYQGDLGSALFFSRKPVYHGIGGSISHYFTPSFDIQIFGASGDIGFQTILPYVEPPYNEAGFRARIVNASIGLRYKFNNDILLPEDARIAPYLLAGWGGVYIHSDINNMERNYTGGAGVLTGGVGVQVNINEKLGLRFQSLSNYVFNDILDGSPFTAPVHTRWKNNDMYMYHSIGIVYTLPMDLGIGRSTGPRVLKDSDGDGVPNKFDKCPNTPQGWIVDSVGCPLDTDLDGVYDHADSCRYVPGLPEFDGCPDTDGDGIPDRFDRCPDHAGPASLKGCPDRDGDGVADIDDRCPDHAGPASLKGCPDRDGDGVPDIDDKCPDKPGPAEHEGCPDSDGDGVYDNVDKCPDVPGTVENKGCPEIKKEDVKKMELAAKGIYFETNKAIITPASFKNLDILAQILSEYPEAIAIIEGHTDNTGTAEHNKTLSQERADAVKKYLVDKGVDPIRLTSVGYGQERPIADNNTTAGKAKNRRVYFQLKY